MLPKPGNQINTEPSKCRPATTPRNHIMSKKSMMIQLYRYHHILKKEKPKKRFSNGYVIYGPPISEPIYANTLFYRGIYS